MRRPLAQGGQGTADEAGLPGNLDHRVPLAAAQVACSRGSKSQECLRDRTAGLQAGCIWFRLGSDRTRGAAVAAAGKAWTVFDKVTITYRGAKYEIGRGWDFYGIWTSGAPRSQPLERWPETPEGWSAAWTRFASIEAPGTIVPVGRRTAPAGLRRRAGEPSGAQREGRRDRRGGAARPRGRAGGRRALPVVPRRFQPRPAGRTARPARHLPGRLDRERRAHPPRRRPPAARRAARPGAERGYVRPVLRGRRHGHRGGGERRRRRARARPPRLAGLRRGVGGRVRCPPGRRALRTPSRVTRARWRGRADPRSVPW